MVFAYLILVSKLNLFWTYFSKCTCVIPSVGRCSDCQSFKDMTDLTHFYFIILCFQPLKRRRIEIRNSSSKSRFNSLGRLYVRLCLCISLMITKRSTETETEFLGSYFRTKTPSKQIVNTYIIINYTYSLNIYNY